MTRRAKEAQKKKKKNQLEDVPPCSSCTMQERCLQEGEPYLGSCWTLEEAIGHGLQENDLLCKCDTAQETQDFVESRTSPHKDASERAQEELERERMTPEFVMKGKEAERLKIEKRQS
jgi:hypothetical protein